MKFASFLHQGTATYGAVIDDQHLVDLRPALGALAPDLQSAIAQGLLDKAATLARAATERIPLDTVEFLPVIGRPAKIVCVGLNYADHVRETGRQVTQQQAPTLFLRVRNSQAGHGQALLIPPESPALDFEGEIAVIIGKPGRRIAESAAWAHVAGYACYNDASIRDWQTATSQWTAGKNFARTGAFGPWMVTADEIRPDQVMTLVTRLNGEEVQRTTTDLLIHSIPSLIAHISCFTELEAGDVIVTGTPGGVGFKRQPPLYMRPGDVVEVEVDALGVLRNPIEAEMA
ncbi:fumarylacetoacetate hydrolase family protein [Hydrogenophaga sp. UC242_53]|uniref:fumarylacetoacetate hydrolase family protein n=1 Tax=Hydrogenophaga sp. UC242_53 TaxID=3350170 RepID=UPI0036D36FA1